MLKIVVVEDEPFILMALMDLLEGLGHEVVDFSRAERALEYIKAGNQYDILITDVNLPGMDGRELSNAVRALDPEKPIIFATGYAINRVDYLSAPFATITKPYWEENISDAISKVLGLTDS